MTQTQITMQDGTQLDPGVLKVVRGLRQVESNGDYNAVGDGGTSHGAYQFHNDNWKNWAKQYLGDENAPMTPANQNKLMYKRVAEQKAQGLDPEEIAALHNGAHKDENGKYVYNNPEYGKKFRKVMTGKSTEAMAKQKEKNSGFLQSVAQTAINPFLSIGASGASALTGIGQVGAYLAGNQELSNKFGEAQSNIEKGTDVPYFGKIKPLQNPVDAMSQGAQAGLTLTGIDSATGLVKNLFGSGKALANPLLERYVAQDMGEFAKSSAIDKAEILAKSLQGDVGVAGKRLLTQALDELEPALRQELGQNPGLLRKVLPTLAKYGWKGLKGLIGLGGGVGLGVEAKDLYDRFTK